MTATTPSRQETAGVLVPRVVALPAAAELLDKLRDKHGPLMMHQSGGCCDGSSPMCYPQGEFMVGDREVLLGVLDLRLFLGQIRDDAPSDADGVPVWISPQQFAAWEHTQLVLDVVPGRGAGFSVEGPEGVRFLTRSRVFNEEETAALAAQRPLTGADWDVGRRPAPATQPQVVAQVDDACAFPQRS
ncbi:DUF779 domain-containing protein [Georgenia sunbinii]|uniref:DUF779 domain-containing protein n=1 Tax=Georgenia sunbinii TaxID=3117728 RepID=UPI002F26860B